MLAPTIQSRPEPMSVLAPRRPRLLPQGQWARSPARKPAPVNEALRDFTERVSDKPRRDPTAHRPNGRRRALYVSSPIGLGHARRDVAIARELRAARARPGGRLAGAEPGHARARGRGRDDPSRQPAPGQRVRPHRVGVGRARPALLPGVAPDGRDPRGELHGLPRPRARAALRPLDRRRGLGGRLLPARAPEEQAGAVRLADRLRRLAADDRRRRSRGLSDRRLQRRDGRAHRRQPRGARPGAVRGQPRRHRARPARPRAAR